MYCLKTIVTVSMTITDLCPHSVLFPVCPSVLFAQIYRGCPKIVLISQSIATHSSPCDRKAIKANILSDLATIASQVLGGQEKL